MKKKVRKIIGCLLVFIGLTFANTVSAQNYDWWIYKHNWDFHSHWTTYLNVAPAYFGPNALPVLETRNARIEKDWAIEFRPETHFQNNDFTVDLFTRAVAPLGKRVSFEVFLVPLEYYSISDTNIRDERFIRNQEPKGFAGGDFWIGTHIQILEDFKRWPDIQLSVYMKTASGTNLEDARYTDTPGYSIFFSMGKYISGDASSDNSLRWYANLGTYVWQTYEYLHFQNDAINYGAAFEWKRKSWYANLECAGYFGYLGDGDRPVLVRTQIGKTIRNTDLAFRYSYGLNDFPYQTFAVSLTQRLRFNKQ